MSKCNPGLLSLADTYLFETITEKVEAFKKNSPEKKLIDLGIGDTSLPLPPIITDAIKNAAARLSTPDGYSGYGSYKGNAKLRQQIADTFYPRHDFFDAISISDGAGPDIGRLQHLFSDGLEIGIQDPSYPAYKDLSIMQQKGNIHFLPCTPANDFFPILNHPLDLIYICSPMNPTGTVATREQLESLVHFAQEHHCIIIYDNAYSCFIQDHSHPKSIYEIEGAEKVAIEVNSFSKLAGFTGVRLGWTVVPQELSFADNSPILPKWERVLSTHFNGASNLSQAAGFAALSKEGLSKIHQLISRYLTNAKNIKNAFQSAEYVVHGGEHAPYLWIDLEGYSSWEAFDALLHQNSIITIPGIGFGPSGEGFLRASAFGYHSHLPNLLNIKSLSL